MALVPKLAPPLGHMFYIGLYIEHIKQSYLKTIRPRAYIWHVASPTVVLHLKWNTVFRF